ncbi:MAG: hypothetical protein ABEJ76_05425 [Halanaeroarchaeum sp.]
MDLDELRAVQTRERATDGLQELRDTFYADVATYLEDLRERREDAAAEAENPFRDPTVNELTDEIETAEQVAEAIYERRIGKLVKQASLAAAGMPDDQTGLTAEERDLYGDLVDRIEENKTEVLDVIAGDAAPDTDGRPAESDAASSESAPRDAPPQAPRDAPPESDSPTGEVPADGPTAAEAMGGADDGSSTSGGGQDRETGDEDDPEATVERTTVRITQDVGDIYGVDEREYSLEADDVVTLPRENAKPLVERDAAEELE